MCGTDSPYVVSCGVYQGKVARGAAGLYLCGMPSHSIRVKRPKFPTSVVTGGAGFLGSHLVDLLLAKGHRVIALDNFVTGTVENIDHLSGNRNFKFVHQDVTEYIFLHESVDYVWHFASPASPIDYLELPIQTLKVGSLGTHKALGLAKYKGARVILIDDVVTTCSTISECARTLDTAGIGEIRAAAVART